MISAVVISPDDSEGVVLAKVMETAKEIRPDDKKTCKDRCQDTCQPPLRLGAGRLCGLLADAGLSGCRRCKEGGPAAGVGGAGGGGQGSGVMVCRGWPGRAMVRRQFGGI